MRTLLATILAVGMTQTAHAQCEPDHPPASFGSDVVCCSVNQHSQWTNHVTCERITQAASACFKQGGEDYNPSTQQCLKSAPLRPEQQQQRLLENAARVEFCSNKMSLTIEALSLKNAGFSQAQTTDQLVSRYAYGPGGQAYQASARAESVIGAWVADVYLTNKYVMGMDFRFIYDRCMMDGR